MEQMAQEASFKFIPGYEGLYSATTDGRIYRHPRGGRKGGFLNTERKTLYIRVALYKNGITDWHAVHRLVAQTFIPNPENKPQVNHKNFDRHDNSVDNLEWVTWPENWQHARGHGRFKGKMLSEEEQKALYLLYCTGLFTQQELAAHFGTSRSSVCRHIRKHKDMSILPRPHVHREKI
ncbi:hypothetical protein BVX95_01010, partial [archaeon D22]